MDVAVGAIIAKIAKKVITILLGDKKGRKFLLYVVGIVLFVLSIPLITLLGLFGWMAGDSQTFISPNGVISNLPPAQQMQMATIDATCKNIETVFLQEGLSTDDHEKAVAIYLGYLVGMESEDSFGNNLANCFLNTTPTKNVYDLVSETFLVAVTLEDQIKMDDLYGETPIRIAEETAGEAETTAPLEPSP